MAMITMREVRKAGIEALAKALGPVGMSRFFQQIEPGKGNYTEEREQWLGDITVEEALKELKQLEQDK